MSDDRESIAREIARIQRADFRTFETATLKRAFGGDYAGLPEGFEIIDYPSGQSDVINLRAAGQGNA
jgi:hypothetical protein